VSAERRRGPSFFSTCPLWHWRVQHYVVRVTAVSPDAAAPASPPAPKLWVLVCLLAVYVIWGSTYFGMRVALEVFPPFLMGGIRFLLAGSILFIVTRARGAPWPTPKQWLASTFVGALLLACGNGFVGLAERSVDSGVAATVVATMPLWAALFGAFFGDRPSSLELVGLLLGFGGVLVLNRGGSLSFHGVDAMVLVLAPMAWALGSVWSRRLPVPQGLMSAATQMMGGGAVMLALALVRGERPIAFHLGGLVAFGYLVTFGSLLGFTAYGYLLRNTRPALATSYAYVNPVVALVLGALWNGESFTRNKIVACVLTIAGVGLVTLAKRRPAVGKKSE
jgi:drug/metabolite transporter (DMT)-like permease